MDGCNNQHCARGLCKYHYRLEWNIGIKNKRQFRYSCSVIGCDRKHVARGLCQIHYREVKRRLLGVNPKPKGVGYRELNRRFDAAHPEKRKEYNKDWYDKSLEDGRVRHFLHLVGCDVDDELLAIGRKALILLRLSK